MNSINAKVNLAVKLLCISLVVFGVLFTYTRYIFYNSSKVAIGIISKINKVTNSDCYRGCYLTREVTISFKDNENRLAVDSSEYFTGTLVSGVLSVGNKVKVLYKPTQVRSDILDFMIIKNIGTPAYVVELYTWHYWVYPILLIFSGPLLYLFYRKWSETNYI